MRIVDYKKPEQKEGEEQEEQLVTIIIQGAMFEALRLRSAAFAEIRGEKHDKNWRLGEASNLDKTTLKDGRSVGPENRGKTRGKLTENVRETRTILPIGYEMVMGSRH